MDKKTASFVILLASRLALCSATETPQGHVYDIGIKDKVFTENIIFDYPSSSLVECGMLCKDHGSCETHTFYQGRSCRGHNSRMTACSASVPMRGARSYAKKPLGVPGGYCQETGVKRVANASLGLDLDVYCEGTWMVFQKRQDGSVDFYRDWTSYANGFGDVQGEHWMGLEPLHRITTSGVKYDLRVDLMKWDGSKAFAYYSDFSIGSAADFYTLNFDCFLGGTTSDGLTHHRGSPFSTFDEDHDGESVNNRAVINTAAWWFRGGLMSHLNAVYKPMGTKGTKTIWWISFSTVKALKSCQMMIRPALD